MRALGGVREWMGLWFWLKGQDVQLREPLPVVGTGMVGRQARWGHKAGWPGGRHNDLVWLLEGCPLPQGLKCNPTFRSLWSVCCSL